MARRKKLSFAGAMALANKGKAKIVKGKKSKKPPMFTIPSAPKGKRYK